MKNISIVIGTLLLLLNVVLGLMLSVYPTFNWLLNSVVLLLAIAMLYGVSALTIKDGFRVSLNCLIPMFSLIEVVCGCFARQQWHDNLCLIIILLLWVIQAIVIISAYYLTKKHI